MMDWTDRHCRYFHRLLTSQALLYTEMVTAQAVIRGDRRHLLAFSASEHPVAVQLGGSDPAELAEAAQICAEFGYDEINLNVGCPSDRVQSGLFGAVLMERPERVAECVAAMIAASDVEVSVKCRTGVDDQDPQTVLPDFLMRLQDAGVRRATIHARKAWLQGLSPKQNRDIPPLDYPLVYQMAQQFPDMHVSINGGIGSIAQARAHLQQAVDGVMIGRAAYHTPYDVVAYVDRDIFGLDCAVPDPIDIVQAMVGYIDDHIACGGRLNQITRHMLGLFAGRPGARGWRRMLSDHAHRDGAGASVVLEALDRVQTDATRVAS